MVMFTSTRCSPQSASICPPTTTSPTSTFVRGPLGSPCTVIARYDPCSLTTHSAVSIPGTLTNGVSIVCGGFTQLFWSDETELTMLPLLDAARYECSGALPP